MNIIHKSTVILLFTFVILGMPNHIFASVPKNLSFDSQNISGLTNLTKESTPTPSIETQEYSLPYPGILPDHPLFFLKNLRDRLLDFLISEPIRKAEFYILQADKRLVMATFLESKGNKKLFTSIINESEMYLLKAGEILKREKEKGTELSTDTIEKIMNSFSKHQEVISDYKEMQPEIIPSDLDQTSEKIREILLDIR